MIMMMMMNKTFSIINFTSDGLQNLLHVTGIMAKAQSIPQTFEEAFNGIRANLVEKILPSPRFWNLMMDNQLLSNYHVEKLKVFALFKYIKLDPHVFDDGDVNSLTFVKLMHDYLLLKFNQDVWKSNMDRGVYPYLPLATNTPRTILWEILLKV